MHSIKTPRSVSEQLTFNPPVFTSRSWPFGARQKALKSRLAISLCKRKGKAVAYQQHAKVRPKSHFDGTELRIDIANFWTLTVLQVRVQSNRWHQPDKPFAVSGIDLESSRDLSQFSYGAESKVSISARFWDQK
jgi:hypothetical protein